MYNIIEQLKYEEFKLDFNKNFIVWLNNHKRLNDKRRKRIKRGGK